MFDRIAPVYDVMNRMMTAGLDGAGAGSTAEAVVRPGDRVLDACCGTGDLAVAAARAGGRVTGLDFSERDARARAAQGARARPGSQGDLLELPFGDGAFDAATVGFGIRNVDDLERALRELRRVLRPGGRLAILEITQPRGPARSLLPALVRPESCRSSARCFRAAPRTRTCPPASGASPVRRSSRSCSRRRGLRATCAFRLLRPAAIVALHTGDSRR